MFMMYKMTICRDGLSLNYWALPNLRKEPVSILIYQAVLLSYKDSDPCCANSTWWDKGMIMMMMMMIRIMILIFVKCGHFGGISKMPLLSLWG
jgi:hypothetical protein